MSLRRFIAGAVCPECRAMDRLVIEREGGVQRRRCVACGYVDELPSGVPMEPSTRLTRRPGDPAEVTPVRLIDPPRKPKS